MVDESAKCAYSTLEYAKLRKFSIGELRIDHLETKRNRIANIRANVASILTQNSAENRQAFVSYGFDLWNEFVDAPPPYKLPRPYVSSELTQLFQMLLSKLFALEACSIYPEGGNVVLNGVKGVGKTTVLRIVGVVAACLLNKVLPVYWIFEKTGDLSQVSPKQLALATRSLFNTFDLDSIASFDVFVADMMLPAEQKVNCRKILFLFDQFTNLYRENIDKVFQFREIARDADSLFLLAASKFNVREYIFPSHRSPLDQTPSMIYPDLNCGLFEVQEVRPIRKTADLKEFCRISFPGKEFTVDEIQRIFSMTGGIRRHIVNYVVKGEIHRPFVTSDLQRYPQLWHIACRLLTTEIRSSSIAEFAALHDVDNWIDNLILYNDGHQLLFLFPYLLEEFREFVSQEANKTYLQAHIFQIQRRGFEGGSSGHSNEAFLCRYMPKMFGLESHERSIHMRLTSAGSLSIEPLSDTSGDYTNVSNPEEVFAAHHKTLIKWSVDGKETGIDRIWFDWQGDENLLVLTGIQVKTGCDRSTITCGVLSTQRMKKRAKDCDDTCIAGILSKAERGFAALIPALRAFAQQSIPSLTIDINALHICTNKKAENGFRNFFAGRSDYEFQIDQTLRATRDLPASFECILHDGSDWIENELLPTDLSPFVKQPK